MQGWTLVDTHPTRGRTFQRPLGTGEQGFFWMGLFNGHCDILRYIEIRLLNGTQNTDLFSNANLVRAWVSTKRRFPLAGATLQRQDQGLELGTDSEDKKKNKDIKHCFVVHESDLSVLRPGEIVFGQVADAAEAQNRAAAIPNGPRPLSEELLVQLCVFRETDSERVRADVLHVTVLIAHCVADEMASRALVRCFLDTLARGSSQPEPVQVPLEDRLAMMIPAEELEPAYLRALSPVRRRWRRAGAAVILRLRFARNKGGHTLPCRITKTQIQKAARPNVVETSLTQAQSSAAISKCRQHKITIGNAYLPLAQVAMTRVLYRRYLRGEISEEEWTFRKRQPHVNRAPINLRPYLDKAWFDKGGAGELIVSSHACNYVLPFMTLGGTDREDHGKGALLDSAPSFSDLLTFNRFLHRAGLVKKQGAAFFNHPLFFELKDTFNRIVIMYQRPLSMQWMGNPNGNVGDSEEEALAAVDIPSMTAHVGSSLGNMDPIFPFEYPLPPTNALSPFSPVSHPSKAGYVVPFPSAPTDAEVDMAPTIAVECARTYGHALPGELYLGAETWRGQLKLYVFYDGNVFEEAVVREWLDEVKAAVLWYLD